MERRFVEWKEQFVSQERGNRVVHYIVKDSSGDSFLAVVGTERSLRHMVYVVSDEFLQVSRLEKSINACFKWRSRREVVDWLTSLLAKQRHSSPPQPSRSPLNERTHVSNIESPAAGFDEPGSSSYSQKGNFTRKLLCNSEIVWLGSNRICGRQLKHYGSFSRNGIIVEVHSFVFVMSKDDSHYLAYLDDMYEDKKGKKKVKVRWFHQQQEVAGKVPPPDPHPREVFITPYFQVISAECVDGVAFVLTPEHYKKCLGANMLSFSARTHLCFRQFSGSGVTSFNISRLKGYFEQRILTCLDQHVTSESTSKSLNMEEKEEFDHSSAIRETHKVECCKRHQLVLNHQSGAGVSGGMAQMMACNLACRRLSFGHVNRSFAVKCIEINCWVPYKVNDKVELLCQDSGIRGCWFRCTVLQVGRKQLKVCYDDVQDDGGCGNLEEWVPTFRLAAPDKLGMRFSGRLTVRPCPPTDRSSQPHVIGTPVDAWWNDGWWEGVVTCVDNCGDGVQVYFPGEDDFSVFERGNLRTSKDWVGNQWVDIVAKPDILSIISAISPGTKFSACSEAEEKRADCAGSRLLSSRGARASSLEPSLFAGVGKDAGAKMIVDPAVTASPAEGNFLVDCVKQEDSSRHASPDQRLKFHDEACTLARHSEYGRDKEDTAYGSDGGSVGGNHDIDNHDDNDDDNDDCDDADNANEDDNDAADDEKCMRLEKKIKLSDGEAGSNLLVAVNVSS